MDEEVLQGKIKILFTFYSLTLSFNLFFELLPVIFLNCSFDCLILASQYITAFKFKTRNFATALKILSTFEI